MASINYAFKEIISKIVYYGPGLSGKTTNLQHVFKKVPAETRGELISLATDADRTLYFDFLPVNVGTIRGFATKFQLYTVPGQVYYNATRKLVLRGVDGLVFVADSQQNKMEENIESLQNLKDNLEEYGYDINQLPMVIQYNKRDLANIADISELEKILNPGGLPYFEAVAVTGEGVFKTLKAISKLVLDHVRKGSETSPKIVKARPVGATVSASSPQISSEKTDQAPVQTPESRRSTPGIVAESGTRANVVVSDSPDQEQVPASETVEKQADSAIEQTVLKEEVSEEKGPEEESEEKYPEATDDEETEDDSSFKPAHSSLSDSEGFDEEATQISDLSLKSPLPLGKPQMAESRRVKGKKGKFGLFNIFKKKKK
jgi:signal recognition particle receptor subunit beta